MGEMNDEEMNIVEQEDIFIRDLNELGDFFLQYEYLVGIAQGLPKIPANRRNEANRIKGCQTQSWMEIQQENGRIHVLMDSDSLIIRGILAIAVYLFDGRSAQEIRDFHPRYIKDTNIAKQISTDRFHGLESAIEDVRKYAAELCE